MYEPYIGPGKKEICPNGTASARHRPMKRRPAIWKSRPGPDEWKVSSQSKKAVRAAKLAAILSLSRVIPSVKNLCNDGTILPLRFCLSREMAASYAETYGFLQIGPVSTPCDLSASIVEETFPSNYCWSSDFTEADRRRDFQRYLLRAQEQISSFKAPQKAEDSSLLHHLVV